METVTANLVTAKGKLRKATLNGRDYLVAPVTMVVPGVLSGSEGPGLYTDEENGKSLERWNGVPLVAYHPMDSSGGIASARDPEVLDKRGMGWVFRVSNDGKLASEAWFDIDWTRRVDATLDEGIRVLPRLEKGEAIEVSTGLKVTKVPAQEGSVHNGIPYDWVAKDYEPDHLAVLPDVEGACNIKAGCGLLVNQLLIETDDKAKAVVWQKLGKLLGINDGNLTSTKGDDDMAFNKKSTVDFIVANCDCWKDPKDIDILNGFSDNKLLKLKEGVLDRQNMKKKIAANAAAGNAEGDADTGGTDTEVAPGVTIATLAEYLSVEADPGQDPAGYIKELLDKLDMARKKVAGEAAPPPEAPVEAAPALSAGNKGKAGAGNKKQTYAEWEASMPPQAQEVWNRAKKVSSTARKQILNQLLKAVPKDRRDEYGKKLANKKTHELEDMLELLQARGSSSSQSAGNRSHADPDEDDEGDEDDAPELYFPVGRQGRVAANSTDEMEDLQPGSTFDWGARNGKGA